MINHMLFTWNACVLWRIQFISIPFMVSVSLALGVNIGVRSHNVYLDEMLASSTFHPQWWDHLSRQGREADKTKCSIESKVKITTRLFLQFCDIITRVNHPQEELAKFGYRSQRKVENSNNPAIFWPTAVCLNMALSEKKKLKNLPNLATLDFF